MGCLSNTIGIRSDCDTTAPDSGLYINDLPGISLNFVDATINEEYASGKDLINKKIALAEEQIKNEVYTYFNDKVYAESLIDNNRLGEYQENLQLVSSQSGKWKGIKIDLDKSGYTKLFISSISLFLASAITTDVKIFNLITGKELASKSVTTVADEPTAVTFNQEIQTERQPTVIFIAYDSGVADSRKTILSNTRYYNECSECCYSNAVFTATSGTIDKNKDLISDNLVSENNTGGLSVEYSVYCTLDNFVCNHSRLLALPLMYKVGEMLATEAMHSDRVNSYINIDDNEGLADYMEKQYDKRMKHVLGRMRTPNDICFHCRPAVRRSIEL